MKRYIIIGGEATTVKTVVDVMESTGLFSCHGSTPDPMVAHDILEKELIDVVFLDIDTIPHHPFKLIPVLRSRAGKETQFIVISHKKAKAYKAYKHGCHNFLFQPQLLSDLHQCLEGMLQDEPHQDLLCIRTHRDYKYLEVSNILFLHADNNTTDIYIENALRLSTYSTLTSFEERLTSTFKRVHKSYIINTSRITEIRMVRRSFKLRGYPEPVPFSRSFLGEVEEINKQLMQRSL